MSDTVKINVWLSDYKREEFTSIHKKILEKYDEITQCVFSSIEEKTEIYGNQLVEKYGSMYDYEAVDPGDIFENISDKQFEYYQMEKLMEYNVKLSILSTSYQILEQQLRKFIYEELNQSFSPVRTKEFSKVGTNMKDIKELYKLAGYDVETYEFWEDISVLADIINTFKHGEGPSSKRLVKKKPDLFLKSYFNVENLMDKELTTNTVIVLDIYKIDIHYYISIIISFWNQFPEHIHNLHTFSN